MYLTASVGAVLEYPEKQCGVKADDMGIYTTANDCAQACVSKYGEIYYILFGDVRKELKGKCHCYPENSSCDTKNQNNYYDVWSVRTHSEDLSTWKDSNGVNVLGTMELVRVQM